jgi:hypothetical protein
MSNYPFIGKSGAGAIPALTIYPVPSSGDTALYINPNDILAVEDSSGGRSYIHYTGLNDLYVRYEVSEAPATIAAQIGLVQLTDAVTGTDRYYPLTAIHSRRTSGSGAQVQLSPYINSNTQILTTTESLATVEARIAAALAISGGGGGGGSTASYTAAGTTQGTATAITTVNAEITGGGADTGVILDTATTNERRWIHNTTSTRKFIYPAVGGFIDPAAVNIPISIGSYEAVELVCSLAGHWSRDVNCNSIAINGAGSTQGSGTAIGAGVDIVLLNAAIGNTAATLFAATPNAEITIRNVGSAVGRLFPATGGTICSQAANAVYQIDAGSSITLVCAASGAWLDKVSQIEQLAVSQIRNTVTTGFIAFHDQLLGQMALIGTGGNVLNYGTLMGNGSGEATAGGNQGSGVQISVNVFTITTCATLGDTCTISGIANPVEVLNQGAAASFVYCPVGSTMDGTLNGFAVVYPGENVLFRMSADGTTWVSQKIGSERAQTLTATPAGTQATSIKASGKYVVLGTVATAGDSATIDPLSGLKEFIVFNNAGVAAGLFPPVGGTIDGGATDAVFSVPRSCAFLLATANGLDYKVFLLPGATQVATASTGSDQATGTPVVSPFVNITAVGTAGDSVSAKNYSPRSFLLWNRAASNSLDFFPTVGGAVNGGAANAAFAIAAGTGYRISSIDGLAWLAERVSDTFRGSATLVGGAFTFDAGAIGADQAAKITTLTGFKRVGVVATNAGTIGADFLLTIVAGTSLVVQSLTSAGASDVTDVSEIKYEIVF